MQANNCSSSSSSSGENRIEIYGVVMKLHSIVKQKRTLHISPRESPYNSHGSKIRPVKIVQPQTAVYCHTVDQGIQQSQSLCNWVPQMHGNRAEMGKGASTHYNIAAELEACSLPGKVKRGFVADTFLLEILTKNLKNIHINYGLRCIRKMGSD
jgi:hypothetical protein